MKLKNVLVLVFLTLTLIPIIVVSFLLYESGFKLAKESYMRNLTESINVQVDYISQTIENNMIFDYRFAHRKMNLASSLAKSSSPEKRDLLLAVQSYLESSEDKITVCILFDKNNAPVYTIGEKAELDGIYKQLPDIFSMTNQNIMEFKLKNGSYSLGIITPVRSRTNIYMGSLVSIYDKSYIFKIISSYYKISNTTAFFCRENGEIINSRQFSNEQNNLVIEKVLYDMTFEKEGTLNISNGSIFVSGFYKNINKTPWYLVGFVDDNVIYSFTNQFISIYILIVVFVLIIDVALAVYFSQKVVEPINNLIKVMDQYQNNLDSNELDFNEKQGYFETRYLRSKFSALMKTILLFRHNFEGMYQLYQSSDMGDTNIDIDVKKQIAVSNKAVFQELMDTVSVPEGACVVEKFTTCFCEIDQALLTTLFEKMRDEHLSVNREVEVYTPYLNQKWFHTLVVPMYENDRLSRLFVQLRDITAFKKKEIESLEQARRDSLTGLYNRAGFTECVNMAVLTGGESNLHGLLFIDMDYFKLVNDNLGHSAGDDLLRSVGTILLDTVGSVGVVSRFGGDEFAVFLPHTSMLAITQLADELKKRLIYPFQTESIQFVVSASIGISSCDQRIPHALEGLLQQADAAMYHAKREFKESMKRTKETLI